MSVPPQGGWQPPPNQGPPLQGPPQPPPNWRQGPWPPEPPPIPDFAPDKSNTTKYLLIGIAVLLVVGVSIGATLLFTRGGGGGGGRTTSSSGVPSDLASANDTGPVAIITDEPTCKTLRGINSSLADVEANGWSTQRKDLGPGSSWTADQRGRVESVTTAMRNAANQMVALAKQTPHRVMREMYEQFIAYGRAYADSIPNYSPKDDLLATVNVSIGSALLGICNAVEYGSANRSLALPPASPPSSVANPGNAAEPQRFLTSTNDSCSAWTQREVSFVADTAAWGNLDTKIAASDWTPEQRAIQLAVLPVLSSMANDMESTGRKSQNPVFEDLAVLGALYFRAYVSAGDNYVGPDSWLSYAASRISNAVSGACRAVAG